MSFQAGKSVRMRKRTEIRRVFNEGRRLTDARLTLWATPTPSPSGEAPAIRPPTEAPSGGGEGGAVPLPPARCGVAVSKAHGIAVRRNRIKRICREAFRLIRPELPGGWDFMIVPRVGGELSLRGVQESLRGLARRLVAGRGRERRP